MKAYLIDPLWRSVTEVQVESRENIFALLSCDLIEVCILVDCNDVIYIDDQHMPRDDFEFFCSDLYPDMLIGKGLWVGANSDDSLRDPYMSLAFAQAHIRFDNCPGSSTSGGRIWYQKRDDPPT